MRTLVVEDDPDVQFLVRTLFSPDPGFSVIGVAESAEDAIEMARETKPQIIVLDHGLAGKLTGLEAVPQFKEVAPSAKIILLTAHDELRTAAGTEPGIDAFLLKTSASRLVTVAQWMVSVDPLFG